MRASVLFNLVGGVMLTGVGASALLVLRAQVQARPILGGWDDLILLPFLALGAWLTIHAMYGAEMNGRVNDANRRGREIKAAIRASFAEAKAEDPDLPDLTDEDLERASSVVFLDLHRPIHIDRRTFEDLAREDARADAELGGLKPPSDKDDDR